MPKTLPLIPKVKDEVEKDTVGKPDGPMKFVPEFGVEVGTFTNPREDLYKLQDPGRKSLMHHVPFKCRGYYKPHHCADFDEEEYEYIVDQNGYAMCTAVTLAGKPCSRKAMNMSWLCSAHGGKLHPLDKVINEDRDNMTKVEGGLGVKAPQHVQDRMTRFMKLCQGIISVEDLDDEELARGQCRGSDGTFRGPPPRMIPRGVHDRMVNELFKRADDQLKRNLLDVVETMTSIAKGEAYEPADRIKAATWVFERVRGKNPEVIVHKQDKPWELALQAISTNTRAESRIARGLDPETGEPLADAPQLEQGNETPEQKRERLLAELAALDAQPIDAEYIEYLHDEAEYADGEIVEVEDFTPEEVQELPGDKAEKHQEEVKSLKDRLNSGRRQRAYARSQGREDIGETPFQIVQKGKNEDGPGYLVALKPQATPGKKRGNDDFRHRI